MSRFYEVECVESGAVVVSEIDNSLDDVMIVVKSVEDGKAVDEFVVEVDWDDGNEDSVDTDDDVLSNVVESNELEE